MSAKKKRTPPRLDVSSASKVQRTKADLQREQAERAANAASRARIQRTGQPSAALLSSTRAPARASGSGTPSGGRRASAGSWTPPLDDDDDDDDDDGTGAYGGGGGGDVDWFEGLSPPAPQPLDPEVAAHIERKRLAALKRKHGGARSRASMGGGQGAQQQPRSSVPSLASLATRYAPAAAAPRPSPNPAPRHEPFDVGPLSELRQRRPPGYSNQAAPQADPPSPAALHADHDPGAGARRASSPGLLLRALKGLGLAMALALCLAVLAVGAQVAAQRGPASASAAGGWVGGATARLSAWFFPPPPLPFCDDQTSRSQVRRRGASSCTPCPAHGLCRAGALNACAEGFTLAGVATVAAVDPANDDDEGGAAAYAAALGTGFCAETWGFWTWRLLARLAKGVGRALWAAGTAVAVHPWGRVALALAAVGGWLLRRHRARLAAEDDAALLLGAAWEAITEQHATASGSGGGGGGGGVPLEWLKRKAVGDALSWGEGRGVGARRAALGLAWDRRVLPELCGDPRLRVEPRLVAGEQLDCITLLAGAAAFSPPQKKSPKAPLSVSKGPAPPSASGGRFTFGGGGGGGGDDGDRVASPTQVEVTARDHGAAGRRGWWLPWSASAAVDGRM